MSRAPVWFSAVTPGGKLTYDIHAEDGAYYSYETLRSMPVGSPYPAGMVIATYGAAVKFDPQDNTKWNYVTSPQPVVAAIAASATVNDDDEQYDGPTDEELLQWACKHPSKKRSVSIKGRKVEILERQDTACSSFTPLYNSSITLTSSTSSPTTSTSLSSDSSALSSSQVATTTPSSTSSASTASTQASVSCFTHWSDPDAGDNNQYCLCNESRTLSFLPSTSAGSVNYCAYTTLPPRYAKRNAAVVTTTLRETAAITRSMNQPTATPLVVF
ncbi:hypothetical protein F4777DRAFT_596754 [Nemania sp. FL0916]|nr:hypothetical protein F4777DRAFT_596754 [Nemania sp. FL0916]